MTAPPPVNPREAVLAGDLRVLLMVLVHLTGDQRWLQPPFTPTRDVRLVADPQAGLPEDVADEIRGAVVGLIDAGLPAPAIDDPGELLQRMMSVCLGEEVPVEYVPMMGDDMRLDVADVQWRSPPTDRLPLDVLIIGAGVSGIALAFHLQRLGVRYRIVERKRDIGGTWVENRYPGCGVDTPNHMYSYSFAPNAHWSRFFSQRHEIQQYLVDCASSFGAADHITFGAEVTGARWDDEQQRWHVGVTSDGVETTMSAAVLVSAIGHFSEPNEMPIAGSGSFGGRIFHSAYWSDDVDLDGKRVAVIGTGASAMQIVPKIVGEAASLSIFQRTPQWVRPVPEYGLDVPAAHQWLFEHLPYYERWYRFTQFWRYGDGVLRHLRKDPQWEHPDRAVNRVNDRHRAEMTAYIVDQLSSRPDLVERCVPTYPPFGKRMLIDNGWYAALCRPNTELISDPIDHIDETGVVTSTGRHVDADVVVMATGFAVTNLCARIDIVGRGGIRLRDDWAEDNPTAHLGMTVPGFPNFFCMFGPNTNMGHGGSAIFLAEAQSRYISSALVQMSEADIGAIDCLPEVRQRFVELVDSLHAELIWTHPGMGTYYRNRHGRVVSTMPFRLVDYWHMTKRADLRDYRSDPARLTASDQ